MSRLSVYICFIVFISALSACSSSTKVGATYQTHFDFSQVNRYSFFAANSKFNDQQNMAIHLRNSLEIAIERTMNAQGFVYSEPTEADIIISYHIIKEARHQRPDKMHNEFGFSQYNKAVRYCEHCLKSSGWKVSQKKWRIDSGSLIVDLIDNKNNRSVWRSVYPLDIDVKDNSREVNEKIHRAVNSMLAKYPKKTTINDVAKHD